MKSKKVLSLILSFAMVFSLLTVPAVANETATVPEIEVNLVKVSLDNFDGTITNDKVTAIDKAEAGQTVALQVIAKNNTEQKIDLASFVLQIEYDSTAFTPKAISYTDEDSGEEKNFNGAVVQKFKENGLPGGWIIITTSKTSNTVYLSGTANISGNKTITASIDVGAYRVLGYVLLDVKADVESGAYHVAFSTPNDSVNYLACIPEGKVDAEMMTGISFPAIDDIIIIDGVAPTLGKVTLSSTPVQVDGTTGATVNATATSTSNKDITGLVTWSISGGENSGVSINAATGEITVGAKAKDGLYTVTATAIDGKTKGAAQNATLTVTRALSGYKITVTPLSKAMIIPTSEEITQQFTATAVDRYDDEVTSGFTWSLNPSDIEGVSIAKDGTVTVTAGAKDAISDRQEFSVIATMDNSPGKPYGQAILVVKRDSDRVPSSVVISDGPEGSTLAVPKTGDPTATATYTATVKDQYGAEMSGQTVTWSVVDGNGYAQNPVGVNLNESTGALIVTSAAAGNTFAPPEGTKKIYYIKATCGNVSCVETLILIREAATVTRLALDGDADEIAVPKSDERDVEKSYLRVYDQYGVEMNSSNLAIEWSKSETVREGVTFANGGIKVSSDAAGNDFNEGKCQFTITAKYHKNGKLIAEATKTITLTRQQSVATTMSVNDISVTVPADDPKVANVDATVRDQYGQKMTDAKVVLDGEQEGFVWEDGKLYVTKAAVKHFNNRRQDEVQVSVSLKCGESVQNTVKLKLTLAAAQINKDSAEISGQASIAKPTGEQTNTAVYSILNNEMKDQYGLPITFEPEKLEMELTDKNGFAIADSKNVTLSKGENGNWIISVTKDAATQQTYVLMAKYKTGGYDAIQCAPVKEITIVDKTVSNTLTVTQGNFTYGEEGKLNPVVKKGSKTITNATFVYTKGGQTVTEVKDTGKYTVTATCEDANYIYTGSVDFQILPKKIEVDWIELDGTRYTYNGQQQTVKYTVKDGNTTLVKDRDYTVEGDKQTNAGVHLLKIIGTGNYTSDPTGAPSVNWNIWGLPVRINTATFQPRTYAKDNYSAVLDTLTLVADKDGVVMPDNLTEGNGFTVSDIRVTNNNAGQQPVSFKVTLTNTNYKWAVPETGNIFNVSESAGYTVTINKIDHRAEAVSAEGKYGSTVRVPLAEYLPDGWSVQQSAISVDSNGNGNVHKSFRLEDTTLVVELNNNEALVGKYVKITLPVASTNYNPFTITVTVTAQKKETQTVTANDLNVTYGDAGVKLNASALDNAKLTYQVTGGADVVAVDANGNVTLRKSGIAKIKITAAETEDYGTANTTVTVTVAKRSLTVKANDLTAYVGGQLPALDYTVTGLVSGETLTTVPELELKDVPAGVDPMKTAGTYTIGFKTAPVADKDKYDLTVETGTLTVSSRPNVNPVPAGNSVKLEEAAGGKLTSSVSRATKGTTVTITVKPDAGYRLEELEVLDKNGEALPLKELANGKFSFQMPDSKVTVQASFVQESTYAGYPDVLPQDWFYSSVRYVTERGLMNGTPNGFEPNMDSSRATIWTILARFSGVDTTVVSGEWYAVARQWAMENGVSDGTNPNGVITREQLATMLYRFAKNKGLVQEPVTADLSVFVDAGQISDYALDAMRWAVSVGLLNGMDGSRLAPQGSAARAQVAAMLMRFDQLAK